MTIEITEVLFLALLPVVAFMYSSVGHGGASGYLALMGLFGVETGLMKGSALMLNIFVSGIAFYQYWRGGYFRWKLLFPFAIASVPLAFLGGSIELEPTVYKRLLAVCLLFAILRILGIFGKEKKEGKEVAFVLALLIGALLGFFSGLIGIGGGIILSPILLLLHWANMKETAAVSAMFIFVNSIAGITGLSMAGFDFHPKIYSWIVAALIGGMLGSYSGAKKLNIKALKFILAGVLLIASFKLFLV
ncbi:MAG: hypothetical protein COA57_10450 [Flavobacteriales bacterium]|nr:MAG: hypothetical protein COA57_10450 [Flavobacteriales bacterium]